MKIKRLIKDFGYVVFSNFLTLIISVIVILVVPKLIGVTEYGYWQLFMFYAAYLGLLHLGWIDGIYLRYGGTDYADLNKGLFFTQFLMLMMLQIVFSTVLFVSSFFLKNTQYFFIQNTLAILLLVANAQSYFKFVLQLTNRLREFSKVTILANAIYVAILVFQLSMGYQGFHSLVWAFIFGNFVATIYSAVILKDLFHEGHKNLVWSWGEVWLNISVGIQLLISNAAGLLIVGIVRFGIQQEWGVATFGKISLTFSITNLLMVFIGAISLVLFPKLRKIDKSKISEFYFAIRDTLMPIIFTLMLLYFPLRYYLPLWLTNYKSSLIYMSVLFPMAVYQSKFDILSNTFFKVLRMEKELLIVNVLTMIISTLSIIISAYHFHNLNMSVFSIIITMLFRDFISELYMSKKLKSKFSMEFVFENVVIIIFIIVTWFDNGIFSFISYAIVLFGYLLKKKDSILNVLDKMTR